MPRNSRRRLTRHAALPRPTYDPATGQAVPGALSARQVTEGRRAAVSTVRQVPYLMAELKRVIGVTGVCLGLLAALSVIDHVR